MASILLLIGGHLWTSPRSQKEAEGLSLAGHSVTIAGVWFDESGVRRDTELSRGKPWRFHPVVDLREATFRGRIRSVRVRLRTRLARDVYRRWKHAMPGALGYGAREMLRYAKQAAADLTIVHSESGLWIGGELLDAGYRVGVDFEDWFSRDLLPEARIARPVAWLEALEARLARECIYSITTSAAMAGAIASEYRVPAPQVVYNVFPKSSAAPQDGKMMDRHDSGTPSIHWFSQTIGPGRGLELLFAAVDRLDAPFQIHLRGTRREESQRWLGAIMPASVRERVVVHDIVQPHELPSRIAEHDIGLALETSTIPSSDLTISNKLFQYLQGGLAVIATDTAGQSEVFSHAPEIGALIPGDNAPALARALEALLTDRGRLTMAKGAARAAGEGKFCWEAQRSVVQRLATCALNGQRCEY